MAKISATGATPPSTDDQVGPPVDREELAGKGRPTPTRKEREAARKRPLVVKDRAEARKQSRTTVQAQRERARVGMANGEEKYLAAKDRGPQKRYVRDYVDARWNVGELLIPLMVIVLLLTLIPNQNFVATGTLAIYAFIVLVIIDVVILGTRLKRRLAEKFGADRVERGVRWYATMRSVQLRIMRLPKPQVKRGQFPS